MEFKESTLAMWGYTFQSLQEGAQPIALCEAAMVPLSFLQWPEKFRGRRMVWYVDNTAAMPSFVRGASANPDLERIVGLFWMLAYHLDVQVWFEWVDSDSNWSDGVSRDLASDPFAAELGFRLQQMREPEAAWQQDWLPLWQYAERSMRTRRWEK